MRKNEHNETFIQVGVYRSHFLSKCRVPLIPFPHKKQNCLIHPLQTIQLSRSALTLTFLQKLDGHRRTRLTIADPTIERLSIDIFISSSSV